MSYKETTFSGPNDIDSYFRKLGSSSFIDWFNTKISGPPYWADFNGSPIKINNSQNWNAFWSDIKSIYGRDTINLIEFISLNTIIINETGGQFSVISEFVGSSGHPGVSYAFDAIPGTKKSYNIGGSNKTAYELFNDNTYIKYHGHKPFADILKKTNDSRWSGDVFPQGFSGHPITVETDKSGKQNTFISEADFFKFRGRGYIGTTFRSNYKALIKFVLDYSGANSIINSIKKDWLNISSNNLDDIASGCSTSDWDQLFQKTNLIIAKEALRQHTVARKYYNNIDPNQSDSNLHESIRNVGKQISGSSGYAKKMLDRTMQQLDLISKSDILATASQSGSTQSSGTQSSPDSPSSNNQGRAARSGQDLDAQSNNNVSGNLTGITNIFGPTIYPDAIQFNAPDGQDVQKEILQGLGTFPFIWYNSYQIDITDIDFFSLYHDDDIPCIKIIFNDTIGLMKDTGFPLDDTKIKVFINPRTSQLKPIFMQFKIKTFTNNGNKYTIGGIMDASNLYIQKYASYKGTSYDAIQKNCKEIGLGFNSNITETDDNMTWINTGTKVSDFMNSIVESSYKSDTSFITSYIDFYYNYNFVDVAKELEKNIQNELGVSSMGIEELSKIDNTDQTSSLFLTNDYAMQNSNSYFKSYKVINNSTDISLSIGYSSHIKFYNTLDKSFLIFKVESITSKSNTSIILKGAPQDDTFYKSNVDLLYLGKADTDNAHKNYQYSHIQNDRNICDLQKIGLEIHMGSPNFNLYKFQKIYVVISNQGTTPSQSHINTRISGEWIIVDIKFIYKDGIIDQIITLVKRELELSPDEMSNEESQTLTGG